MRHTLRAAFPKTLPVLFGYLFLGIAFGVLLQQHGFSALWAGGISLFVYAGSLQFVLVDLLAGGSSLIHCAMLSLMINFRHFFYGLSMIERFRGLGWRMPYLVHALTDETYSLLCLNRNEDRETDRQQMLAIAALDHLYWVAGSVLGGTLGAQIPFDTTGIDFAMTALFVVIFVEQWLDARDHMPALTGGGCALVCCVLFGPDRFLPPALLATVGLLLWQRQRRQVSRSAAGQQKEE